MDSSPLPGQEQGEEVRRRGSLVLQTLPILLIPLGVGLVVVVLLRLFAIAPPADVREPPNPAVLILVLVVFCSALILLVRLRRPTLSALILIGAWTLLTLLAILRSGVSSNVVALLVVPICIAGLLIDAVASVSLAALATLLVLALAWLEGRGVSLAAALPAPSPELAAIFNAAFWTALFWTIAALTSLLSRGLYQALRESRQRAAELRQLSEELEARVQAQTAQLLVQAQERAVLEERARLAREIHDTIAQGLAGAVVQIGAARQGLALLTAEEPGAIGAALAENLSLAERTARETLVEARRSVWNLRAPLLERGSLRDALEQVASQSSLSVSVSADGEPWPLTPAVEGVLLRVAQEALANAVKHAEATSAALTLGYSPDAISLRIADDGRGFPPEVLFRRQTPGPTGGFGILGMEERVAALGGSLRLANQPGACVEATVPRERTAA